jgi:phage terminase large subunit
MKSYKWKEDKNGLILDEPVKFKDHLMDAMRYAIYTFGKDQLGKEMLSLPSMHNIEISSLTRNTLKGY